MFQEKSNKKISISINQNSDICASNILIKDFKTEFDLKIFNSTYSLRTDLLGRHNILNICLATALAKHIGIKDSNIISAISTLEQVPHRLSLLRTNINILDDSYNCSPESSKESLWTLSHFPGKKMIATPGIIECGKEKYHINETLGRLLAYFDYLIIIGTENKIALLSGIKKEAEDKNLQPQIFLSKTLDVAKQFFKKLNMRLFPRL